MTHSALISYGRGGALYTGRSGSGKSSLCLEALKRGFFVYGDEHPLLYASKGAVYGSSFLSSISVHKSCLQDFVEFDAHKKFNRVKRKYDFDPWTFAPNSIGHQCEIKVVLLPRIDPERKRLKIHKLCPDEAFDSLCATDFCYYEDLQSKSARAESNMHATVFASLVRSAACYEVYTNGRQHSAICNLLPELINESVKH